MKTKKFLSIIYNGLNDQSSRHAADQPIRILDVSLHGEITFSVAGQQSSTINNETLSIIFQHLTAGTLTNAKARSIIGNPIQKNILMVGWILEYFELASLGRDGVWKPLWDQEIELAQGLSRHPFETTPRALLDANGNIVRVNRAWRKFARTNNSSSKTEVGIGLNYLDACIDTNPSDTDTSLLAYQGIRSVLDKKEETFKLKYSCHSSDQDRWHLLYVTQFTDQYVSVSHFPVT